MEPNITHKQAFSTAAKNVRIKQNNPFAPKIPSYDKQNIICCWCSGLTYPESSRSEAGIAAELHLQNKANEINGHEYQAAVSY